MSSAARRTDYRPYPFAIEHIELVVDIAGPEACDVTARMVIARSGADDAAPLELDGVDLELVAVAIDGRVLDAQEFRLSNHGLSLASVPDRFTLEISNRICPAANSAYLGLYVEGDTLVADGEPEGFRRVTFFPDRPDVKTTYTVTIRADRQRYPTLLSNGHRVAAGDLAGGRHSVTWHDPIPKASYAFSMVAGTLESERFDVEVAPGRIVPVDVYALPGSDPEVRSGMTSLTAAIAWDREVFGRLYDLDLLNVVALPGYNQGGMEYKGLNIFSTNAFTINGAWVSDDVALAAETTIAHEYFHNWVGNRAGCRDWFNLTLKEGFVVFKHQEFSAAMRGRDLRRLIDVRFLREHQFPEDDGEARQAPRPDSYAAAQNLYTRTTYEKSAEIMRMIRRLLGPAAFRAGCDLFHDRFDLGGAEIEDLVACFEQVSGRSLRQFLGWYTTAGRPTLAVRTAYDPARRRVELTLEQRPPDGAAPMHIPVAVALLDGEGRKLELVCDGTPCGPETVLELCDRSQTFAFDAVDICPTPSLLRDFSAPVDLVTDLDPASLARLAWFDDDAFVRWDAVQQLVWRAVVHPDADTTAVVVDLFRHLLVPQAVSHAVRGLQLRLPSEGVMSASAARLSVDAVHRARAHLEASLGQALHDELLAAYHGVDAPPAGDRSPDALGARLFRNECLMLLVASGHEDAQALARAQFAAAAGMTDTLGALRALLRHGAAGAEDLIADASDRYRRRTSALESLATLQATAERTDAAARLVAFLARLSIDLHDPVIARSVFDNFIRNQPGFHAPGGAGYRLVADTAIDMNAYNARMAARFLRGFESVGRVDADRRELMLAELARVLDTPNLSEELRDVAQACLAR